MASDHSGRGKYIRTGWRIVGREADAIAERAAGSAIERLEPGQAAYTLYAVQFTLEPRVLGRTTVERLLDALEREIRTTWPDSPRLQRDQEIDRPPSRFGGMRLVVMADPGREWLGELIWRAVHPVVAGAAITTRVLIEERVSYTRVNVRVTADDGLQSVRGFVGAGQTQPAFLRSLRRDGLQPLWIGSPLGYHLVRDGEVCDLVDTTLASSERSTPAVILAPNEEGGYIVEPEDFAWDLLGRAKLYVLQNHKQTFLLSDSVGDRRMSCYWGAARAYMPGWSRHDDPYDHPLLVSERLADPVMRAVWLGELGVWLGTRLTLPVSIASPQPNRASTTLPADVSRSTEDRTESRSVPAPAGPAAISDPVAARPESDVEDIARLEPAPDVRSIPAAGFEVLVSEVKHLGQMMDRLADEVERLRTITAVRSSSTGAIERRLARMEDLLEEIFPAGRKLAESIVPATGDDSSITEQESEDESGQSLAQVVQDVAESHSDALVILDSAVTSASESPYEDPERVRAILEAMARVASRRRDGLLGTSLREAFADLGIDYRAAIAQSTSARLRAQYRFSYGSELFEAEEHIVLGNTYNPRRCLRIYFTSRMASDPRFVIAHVGRHFEVKSSS